MTCFNNLPVRICPMILGLLLLHALAAGQTGISFLETKKTVEHNPELSELLFGIQPTTYIGSEGKSACETGDPLVVECRSGKLSQLYEDDSAYGKVKVVKLIVSSSADLVVLQLSKLQSFKSLEYVHLVFAYDICGKQGESCLTARARDMVSGSRSVTVLYQLSIPQ